jgi:ribosomal protein S27E
MNQEHIDTLKEVKEALLKIKVEAQSRIKNLELKISFLNTQCDHKKPDGTSAFVHSRHYIDCSICGCLEEHAKLLADTKDVSDLKCPC